MNNLSMFPSREPNFSDGDGSDSSSTIVVIEVVDNGYLLSMESDDGDVKMVFTDKKELIKYLGVAL